MISEFSGSQAKTWTTGTLFPFWISTFVNFVKRLKSGGMKTLTTLDVYNLSEKISDKIWNDYDGWSWKVKKTLGLQIINSSDSIGANIAEGDGRYTAKDRKNFYLYARGSFEETKAWLRKLIRRKILSQKQIKEYSVIINELGPKINSFINKTKL